MFDHVAAPDVGWVAAQVVLTGTAAAALDVALLRVEAGRCQPPSRPPPGGAGSSVPRR